MRAPPMRPPRNRGRDKRLSGAAARTSSSTTVPRTVHSPASNTARYLSLTQGLPPSSALPNSAACVEGEWLIAANKLGGLHLLCTACKPVTEKFWANVELQEYSRHVSLDEWRLGDLLGPYSGS